MNRIKLLLVAGAIVAGGTGAANAQVLQPINPNRMADVNSKVIQFDNVAMPVISQPVAATPAAPVNRQALPFTQTDRKVLTYPTLDQAVVPTSIVPLANFSAKRAAATDQRVATPLLRMGAAPITNRQIQATTPAGQEELKDQLNKRIW